MYAQTHKRSNRFASIRFTLSLPSFISYLLFHAFIERFENDRLVSGTRIGKDASYSGDFQDDLYHGRGQLAMADSTFYNGEFRFGMFEGHGRLIERNGNTFEGEFLAGKRTGQGRLEYNDGGFYDGEWSEDHKHGNGVQVSRDGKRIFEGQYLQGERNGQGRLQTGTLRLVGDWHKDRMTDGPNWTVSYLQTGVCYDGPLRDGHPHGRGTVTVHGDTTMECDFVSGLPVPGQGQFAPLQPVEAFQHCVQSRIIAGSVPFNGVPDAEPISDSDSSTDERDDKHHDQGEQLSLHKHDEKKRLHDDHQLQQEQVYEYANGDTFTVQLDDKLRQQGNGKYVQATTGAVYEGNWNDSVLTGKGTLICPALGPSFKYTGRFQNSLPHGLGTVILLDGSSYRGEFAEGRLDGYGVFTDETNRLVYRGDFQDGMKHGQGEETNMDDGTVYSGQFEFGKRCGTGELLRNGQDRQVLYRGEWKDGLQNGEGEGSYEWFNGCDIQGWYQGAFSHGKMHGRGAVTTDGGCVYEGMWENDRPTGIDCEWVISFTSGVVYYGSAKTPKDSNGRELDVLPMPNGFGSQREINGDFYTGSFLDGDRHGSGMCLFDNGEYWSGRWDHGVFVRYGRSRPSSLASLLGTDEAQRCKETVDNSI